MNFTFCPSCGQQSTVRQHDDTNYECTNCRWHFWNNAKGAVAIALIEDGRVLLVERGIEPAKGKHALPGGFIDFGEDAYSAAIREAEEELGVRIAREDLKLLDVYPSHYIPGIFSINIIFVARKWQGTPQAGSDAAAVHWLPFSAVTGEQFSPGYPGLEQHLKKYKSASPINKTPGSARQGIQTHR